VFTHKIFSIGPYQGFIALPSNIKRLEMDSKPPKTLAKSYKYPPSLKAEEKKKNKKKREM